MFERLSRQLNSHSSQSLRPVRAGQMVLVLLLIVGLTGWLVTREVAEQVQAVSHSAHLPAVELALDTLPQ